MRLSTRERTIFKFTILSLDPEAQIFLFGSRANPEKKGGDIDLLVLSKTLSIIDKATIMNDIFKKIEEQKIDIIISNDCEDPFVKLILKEAVRL